ncbi:IclR family transcriptional regulator domain-containing protein [Bradyrhizobium guangzhouense]|uniref:IclR family transcriptional regulator n=1 Tax=Bradyrhizobium guangzhouense TaxID=1325095 RepID=A0AAE5X324_9BRAD|nr:IclR family transcriptional regulator C-terminal domain-containing protein [Bradyrhizobium guangzhouense]QAU48002.1 IclR family transcriptional regulator [Bradyrhizobium guangzhouense]RXH14560.1 IclR family transcriptional regulator [Bradyrhizobium guangzhouense]
MTQPTEHKADPGHRQSEQVHRQSEPGHRKSEPDDKEFMTTLAKGLAVLGAFGRQRPSMTLSEAASVADLSRATARRVLRTLTLLGYVVQDGRSFALSPQILDLGFAYLSTQSWIDRALPLMRELSERLGESCSAAILQDADIVYVARVPARRIMSAALSVGSRLPALHTALGRVLFGYLDEAEIWRRLKSQRIEAYTPQTITDLQALFDRIRADRAQRFSIVDEELERGLRALAVPVLDRGGQIVGAINLSTHSTRTTRNEMREHFLPELNRISEQISSMTV